MAHLCQKRFGLFVSILLFVLSSGGATPTFAIAHDEVDTVITQLDSAAESTGTRLYFPALNNQVVNISCDQVDFGTMLLEGYPEDWIYPADVMIHANDALSVTGLVTAGAPSELVKEEWFGRLPDWTRSFIRGTYDQLPPIYPSATIFGMQDMYECIGYGPESPHQAGLEALQPLVYVPQAKAVADSTGKCLIYGPAVLDYERMATPDGEDQPDDFLLAQLIGNVSPYVDIWMIQLAKYQRWADAGRDDFGNPFTMLDFTQKVRWWVMQIQSANPHSKVWTQLGVGVYDPIEQACFPPQPSQYILTYRAALSEAGVNGVFAMPSQPCQLSSDPQDREYYLQTLEVIKESIELACKAYR